MSKMLETKIDELFEATKDLRSLSEILPHCEAFNAWVAQQNYTHKSLGTLLSKHGLYSKFRQLPLKEGENAELIPKHDAQGNVHGQQLKHYVPLLCGLNNDQWNERNHTTRAISRLENSTKIDPDRYLEITGKLLASNHPHELAVGIIAATGRRPHEVLVRAKFTLVKDKPYHVNFKGQGKKRGEEPVFEIATLYPASYVIKCLQKLRKDESVKGLIADITTQFPKSITKQNVEIDKRRNQSLNRVVRAYFGDKGQENPVLSFRHGEQQDNNKALRAAYAVLATERDCLGSFGAKILHASRLLGHFVKEVKDDRNLGRIGVSAGYADYYVSKPVAFPQPPHKEKLTTLRVRENDFETIKQLQKEWDLPNQQSALSHLIESYQKRKELLQELLEAKNKIAQLERSLAQMQRKEQPTVEQISAIRTHNSLAVGESTSSPSPEQFNSGATQPSEVEQGFQQMRENLDNSFSSKGATPSVSIDVSTLKQEILAELKAEIRQMMPQIVAQPTQPHHQKPATESKSASHVSEPSQEIDWESKSNAELWASKVQGAAGEKIRRSFQAICLYNDTTATQDNDRLAITNQALRALSGVNGLLVGDWIKAHADEVIGHNSKYGMQNSKDPSKVETYYNKRHGQQKIEKILQLVSNEFLDGSALGRKC